MRARKYLGIIVAKTFSRHSWYLIFNGPAYLGISHHGVSLLHWHHVCVIISSFFPFRGVVVPFHLETALTKISILCDFSNLGHCCRVFVRPSREVLKNRFSLMEEQRLKIDLVLLQTVLQRGLKKIDLVSLQTWSQKTSLRSGGAGLVLSTMLIPTRKCLNWVRIVIVGVKQKSMNRPVDQLIQLKIVIIFSKWIVQCISDPGDAAIISRGPEKLPHLSQPM